MASSQQVHQLEDLTKSTRCAVTSQPLSHLVIGYPRLAGEIEMIPETAIFRRFGALNARNLLYLQAELVGLEKDLIKQENKDSNMAERDRYAVDWYWLKHSREQGNVDQLDLVMRIRSLLKQYNMALLVQAKVCSLPKPHYSDLDLLQHTLDGDDMGPLALEGDDATIWGSVTHPKDHSTDLVALKRRAASDPVSDWIAAKIYRYLGRCWCARFKRSSKRGVTFRDSSVLAVTQWVTTMLASLVPVASIAALYFAHRFLARLAIIAGFNLLIATCLSTFTKASRVEMFAVTAATTAVQVVFINTGK